MSRDLDEMTEAELAEWQYAHRDELDSDEGEAVDADVSPQLSVTLSFRVPGSEADSIREAAREAGMSMSEWIRRACAVAAAPDAATARAQKAQEDLDQAVRLVQTAQRRMASEPVRATAVKKSAAKTAANKTAKKAAKKSAAKKSAAKKSARKAN